MVDIKPRKSRVVEEKFSNQEIDPDSIKGLSKEAKKLLKSGKDIRLFNQRGRKDYINQYRIADIDYKDVQLLLNFLNPIGGIISSRVTRADKKHQRALSKAIKRARELALIPFPNQEEAGTFFS